MTTQATIETLSLCLRGFIFMTARAGDKTLSLGLGGFILIFFFKPVVTA